MIFWLSAALLAAAMVCGGATKSGHIGDILVQLIAVGLILANVWVWAGAGKGDAGNKWHRSSELPLLLAFAVFALTMAVQLLPLPHLYNVSWLWVRDMPLESGELTPNEAWWGSSLTPTASWAALASLLPPLAVLASARQLSGIARFRLTAVVIGVSALGLLLGFLQVAGGPHSGLRFFQFTNPTEAVGFFANRNHFAAELYTALLFAAVWFAFAARMFVRRGSLDTRETVWFAAAAALLIATIAGLALARSRAGLLLALIAIAGIVAMFSIDRPKDGTERAASTRIVRRLAIGAMVVAVLFAAEFGLHRVTSRFAADPLADLRIGLNLVTFQMAWENMPFGTGIGSFVPVYATAEKTGDLFTAYANRAHDDWAEMLLETGVFGAVIAALFLWWFVARAFAVWRPRETDRPDIHLTLQRAATLAIALLLVHSLLDYPLRTTAMVTLFAFACAILIEPAQPMPEAREPRHRSRRERATRPSSGPRRQGEWGADLNWPDAWKGGRS
jgi:O-antigen ligase